MAGVYLDWEYSDVPDHTQEAFETYLIEGYPPGGFLLAVLLNNFVLAAGRADYINKQHLGSIAHWVSHSAPPASWGSEQKVNDWLSDKDGVRTRFADVVKKQQTWKILNQQSTSTT
jgi:hypothetical protein